MQQDKTWKNIAPLFANMIFGSWYLLVGGLLALHMSLLNVVITLLIGNVLAAFLFFLVGNIGSKLRLSTYEIAKSSFGKYGSRFLITVLLVAARIGWVAVRAELGGLALAYILGIPNSIGIIIFAVALIIATIGSFKNLSIYGWIALACTIGLSIIGLSTIFQNYQINSALVNNQASTWSIFTGINVVLISKISFGAIVPDFFQKVKTTKDVLLGSFIGFVPAGLIAGTIGAVLTISTGTYDIVKILGILNLSFLAYLFLSVSSFAPATIYPAGVGIASILNKNDERSRVVGTIIAGAIGTFLAFFNMLDKFTQFLNILGIAFAPIMGVMLTDYYIIKNSSNIKIIKLSGLFSWLIGAVVVYITSDIFTFGIASINGLLISGLAYYLFNI